MAGLLLAVAALLAVRQRFPLPDGLVLGIFLLTVAGMALEVRTAPGRMGEVIGLVLVAPGAWLVTGALEFDRAWSRTLLAGVIVAVATLVADADQHRRHLALGPALVAMSVGGMFITLPETSRALAMLGTAVPLAALGWPVRLASLGRGGAYAVAGLVVWVAMRDGGGRPGATVGAIACLGILLVEPVTRWLVGPDELGALLRTRWALPGFILLHLALVLFLARVAGLQTTAAAALAFGAIGLALAVGLLAAATSATRSP
ncbi:MAG: hypothetical protein ACR2G7_07765 [Acidimicrobiales bacterium]